MIKLLNLKTVTRILCRLLHLQISLFGLELGLVLHRNVDHRRIGLLLVVVSHKVVVVVITLVKELVNYIGFLRLREVFSYHFDMEEVV